MAGSLHSSPSGTMRYRQLDSPIGPLLLACDDEGLRVLRFADPQVRVPARPRASSGAVDVPAAWQPDDGCLDEVVSQLRDYFRGTRRSFELALAPQGTPFQLAVWRALQTIPYGETLSYAQVAAGIGQPAAVRAVGMANGANPIAIIVPCHRVIGSNGTLVGFGGGLPTKRALLALEQGQTALL